jgi:hypothetical protein
LAVFVLRMPSFTARDVIPLTTSMCSFGEIVGHGRARAHAGSGEDRDASRWRAWLHDLERHSDVPPQNAQIARDAAARRHVMREKIAESLQPFAEPARADRLAFHIAAVMQGISIQARDGATQGELQEIVEDVVSGVEAQLPRSGKAR